MAIVGLGPGDPGDLSARAKAVLEACDVIVGYDTYVDVIKGLFPDKKFISGGMRAEVKRAKLAIEMANSGFKVALVSGGDAGIYGMAGLALELAPGGLSVAVVPGITAASSVAASLGAPIMSDFAVISLSDLLTPWEEIERRAIAAFEADFVVVLYNPRSAKRNWQLERVRDLGLVRRPPGTPVGVGWRDGRTEISTLRDFCELPIDMSATVVIGNSRTYVKGGRMITPRGYDLE